MKKVMIVDDEIMVRMGMKAIINWEDYGYTIIAESSNGEEALQKIEQEQPDLILVDLKMAKMDGFKLMEICRQRYPAIKFVVLSNYNDFDKARKAMQMGVIDYIFKLTVTPEDLISVLHHADSYFENVPEKNDVFLRKNATAIKSHLMKQAADGSFISSDAMRQDLKRVSPRVDFERPFAVLRVGIDSLKGADTELQLQKYGIENLVEETLNQSLATEVYDYNGYDLLAVFNTASFADFDEVAHFMAKKFDVIKEYVYRYYVLRITAALSDIHCGVNGIKPAVEQTSEMLICRTQADCGWMHTMKSVPREDIMNVCRYIESHLDRQLSLEVVAAEIHMSQSYFSHLFKDEMKMSFTDYVAQARIRRACELLENTRLKISEIALEVGMENINYFGILFKKLMGVSPNTYREQSKK